MGLQALRLLQHGVPGRCVVHVCSGCMTGRLHAHYQPLCCGAVRVNDAAAEAARDNVRCCAALLPLSLHWRLGWPLSLVVREGDLAAYNGVLTLLLQVHQPQSVFPRDSSHMQHKLTRGLLQPCTATARRQAQPGVWTQLRIDNPWEVEGGSAQHAVLAGMQVRWAEAALQQHGRGSTQGRGKTGGMAADALAWEMRHFVRHLRAFVMDGLRHGAAQSFDEVSAVALDACS